MNGLSLLKKYQRETQSTQAQLAERFSVSSVLVHYWLTGQRKPGLRTALAIEQATGGAIPAACWLTRVSGHGAPSAKGTGVPRSRDSRNPRGRP